MSTVLRWAFVAMLVAHGLIHLMGAAKGLGWADVGQLEQPIGPVLGAVWLLAAVLLLATAVAVVAWPRWWWVLGAAAVLVSQAVIVTSWSDAKAGTAANVVLALAVAYAALVNGPTSTRASYERLARAALARPEAGTVVAEADLAGLPAPVAAYVRRSGALGRPRVSTFTARMHGRIRGGADQPWMPFTAEQASSVGAVNERVFFMHASRAGLPVDVLHAFTGSSATMRAKACSLVTVVDASGPEMDRAETVTLFNDLCVFAPSAMLDPAVTWEAVDEHRARGAFTNHGITVHAVLTFDDGGQLVDFVSDDRLQASPDGATFTPVRWSTPLGRYRDFAGRRLAGHGEAMWHPATGADFAYLTLDVDDVTCNPAAA